MRIFITHIVPREKILEYNLSVAACNFCHTLIEGHVFDDVYSILPTFVNKKVDSFNGLIRSSLRDIPGFSKFAPIWENLRLFFKIPRKSVVWYYNCTVLNATLIVLLKLFKPEVRQNMILLDYTPRQNWSGRFLLWLTNRMDATIRLSNSPLFNCSRSICLPGVVPLHTPEYPEITTFPKHFLISGVLSDNISMLPILLKTFAQLPNMILHITGKAPDTKLVSKYTTQYPNIIYHGLVEYNDYLDLLHDVPFLLSTRNPSAPENQCNFPSKIIEALLHNRIIVSTIHYEQLEGIHYIHVPAEPEELKAALCKIGQLPSEKLNNYANQSEIVKKRYSIAVWKKAMDELEKKQPI